MWFQRTINSVILIFCLGKAKRLKQAKEEAQQEIEQYRAQREAQYKKYEQSVSH
jgi:hypothetical protein